MAAAPTEVTPSPGTRSQRDLSHCDVNGNTRGSAPAPSPVLPCTGRRPASASTDCEHRRLAGRTTLHSGPVPLPSFTARPSRLTGLATALVFVSLSIGPSGTQPTGRSAGAAAGWAWPVGPPHVIVRPFQAPETRYSAGHRGIDIDAAPGSPVVSPADGVVHFAGVVVDRPVVSIEHPGGLISSFEPVSSTLTEGMPVARGSPIGVVAGGGHCSDSCVHFGVRLHGEYVSPLLYVGGIEPSVLLPTRPL